MKSILSDSKHKPRELPMNSEKKGILEDPENIKLLLQERPDLRKITHTCMSTEEIKEILQGQKDIKLQLESGQKQMEIFTASLKRIFRLYEDNKKEIEDLKRWKGEKEITNGNTGKTIEALEGKDGDLESKLTELQADMTTVKTDIAVIKATVIKEEKEEDTRWSFKEKVIIAVLSAILFPLLVLLIIFLVKTFIWGY